MLSVLMDGIMSLNEEEVITYMSYGMIASMTCAFICLSLGVTAPYGRYSGDMSLGFMVNGKLAWVIQEAPSLLIPLWCFLNGDEYVTDSKANRVLLLFFIGHYFNRTIIFPLQIRGGKPTPFGVMLSAIFFTSSNGILQGKYLTKLYRYDESHLSSPMFLFGSVLFICGFIINLHSDSILRNLRKPGETGYKIPHGGMFKYVSGANFFGEIMEWLGFAIASGFSLPAVSFAFATACNIAPRAVQHHQWYMTKFDDYEKLGRKAVIPFIY